MAYETIRYEQRDDGVATVALDQPDTRNALSNQLLSDLIAAFEAARDDESVRCVVLASTHDKVFSAGGSLDQFAADVPLVHKYFGTERFPRLFKTIMQHVAVGRADGGLSELHDRLEQAGDCLLYTSPSPRDRS